MNELTPEQWGSLIALAFISSIVGGVMIVAFYTMIAEEIKEGIAYLRRRREKVWTEKLKDQ